MTELRGRTDEERAYYAWSGRAYRALAPFYDLVARPLRPVRRAVVDAAGAGRASRVLDVATGTGAQARAFAEASAEVVGVDLSEAMLRVARRKSALPNLRFLRADATELPFPDGAFDVACISFALHEMPASVRARALRELARVTRPGGAVVVADYGLPAGRWTSRLVHRAVKLYEHEAYAGFVRSDVAAELRRVGVGATEERAALLGVARIWRGTRDASARRERAAGDGAGTSCTS